MKRRIATRTYMTVFLALWALTASTVGAAYLDLGSLSTPVALGIALVKALLVLVYFMHLRISNRMVWLFAAAGFLWLGLLMGGTLVDVLTRGVQSTGAFHLP